MFFEFFCGVRLFSFFSRIFRSINLSSSPPFLNFWHCSVCFVCLGAFINCQDVARVSRETLTTGRLMPAAREMRVYALRFDFGHGGCGKWDNLIVRWSARMQLFDPQIYSARHARFRNERGGNRNGINASTWCFDYRSRSESSSFNETVSHVHFLVGVNHQSHRRKFIYVDIVTWLHRVIPKVTGRGSTETSRRSGYFFDGAQSKHVCRHGWTTEKVWW